MPGPVSIQQDIDAAGNNRKPAWNGTGQLKQITTNLTTLLKERGVLVVGDTTALALISGADSHLVFVEDQGLYYFDANSTTPIPAGSIQAPNGLWRLLIATPFPQYTEVVGDGTNDTFDIDHDLDTLYPDVQALQTGGGLAYIPVDFDYSVTSANQIAVTFPAPPASNDITIIVKK